MSLLSMILALFVILNAVGNVPVFIGLLKDFDTQTQRKIIIRELIFVLIILLVFSYFGEAVLQVLNINIPVLRLGGGILLSLIALDMLFPKDRSNESMRQEPFIVPLATPIIAGPGSISTVIVFSLQLQSHLKMLVCVLAAWIPTFIILFASAFLKKILGEKILFAVERLCGMLLMFISVQMFTTGLNQFIETLTPRL